MKINETILAELDAILADARSPSGGTAFSGWDREQIINAVFAHSAADGARRPLDGTKYQQAKRAIARAREAAGPVFERVGELRSERVARLAAERAHAAAVEAEIKADPPLGSEANPVDLTTPAAIERNDRAERTGRVRPVRAEVAERARRAEAPRRGFAIVDYTNPRRAA
jgi:hypothetical protein